MASLPASASPSKRPLRRWPLLILLGLIGLGFALRVYRLTDIPLGLHHDEGYNALDALEILRGWRPVFLPGNFGREPLFIYLIAFSIDAFGATPWAVRLPGVIAGTLAIPAQYLLVARLPVPRPRLTGLVSAALVAFTLWPVAKGHQGLRAGLLPFWVALTLWAWWEATRSDRGPRTNDERRTTDDGRWRVDGRSLLYAALSGVFVAAALYTHTNGRFLPIILTLAAAWEVLRGRRQALVALVMAGAVAFALALPLLLYFQANPDLLSLRTGQVSVFNPDVNGGNLPGMLLDNAWRLLLMPVVRGTDSNWENLPGRPVFDPLLAAAFLVGIVLLLRDLLGRRGRAPQSAAVLVALTYLVMLVPSWLSDAAPHYGRLTSLWPALFLLPAWGLTWGEGRLRARVGVGWATLALALVLLVSAAWSGWDFWVRYANTPEVHDEYRGAAIARGEAVRALVGQGTTYVSPAVWSQTPIRMVNFAAPPRSFDPRHGLVLPPQGDSRYVFEVWEGTDAEAFARRWPGLTREPVNDASGKPLLLAYHLPAGAAPVIDPLPAPPTFGEAMRLVGRRVEPTSVRPGDKVTLMLAWQALAPTATDLNLFVHLVGPDGRILAQFDGPPLGSSYPTTDWAAGERILQPVTVSVPKDAPAGDATLRLGWYDWRTGERLPTPGGQDKAVEVGRVRVEAGR